ncbi:MAG TPA: ATP-binding protein, partial [Candidatus Limnocylindrales bacterium]
RRAARNAPPANGGAALEAARALRDPVRLLEWAVSQRARGSDRRRKATAALAQMIATSEEFLELFRASERQRSELARNQRRLDRLARETLRASDLERARIGHQIHDTAAQSMVSAFRFLEAARASAHAAVASASSDGPAGSASPGSPVAAGAASAAVDEYLATASERLQTAIQEVRAVLARLLPPGLEELGLAHALRRRTAELATESGLAVEVEGSLPRLEAWVEQALYGMTVEAAGNAVRHGKAQTVRVELAERRGRAVVTVRDDGQGFDPARTDRRGGHGVGLVGLSRQATWLGGRTTIRSQPGSGTVVRISIPLASHLAGGPTEGRADHRERPARPAARVPRPSPVRPSDGRSPELEPMLEPR